MIDVIIPGYKNLQLKYLVMDYNGTLAIDGSLIASVPPLLHELGKQLELHVVTADTFGDAAEQLKKAPCQLTVLSQNNQAESKRNWVQKLGSAATAAIGNGRNDRFMLQEAQLGIGVILSEGAAGETMQSADIVTTSIEHALQLLLNPLRLKATLRT